MVHCGPLLILALSLFITQSVSTSLFPCFTSSCSTCPKKQLSKLLSKEMEIGKGKRLVKVPLSDEEGEEEEDNKKGRALTPSERKAGGSSQISCLVENCTTDMNDAKPYYRRHKVCVFHAKAAAVLIAGSQKRFCQQCSRFHELSEFDEAKRSCRRRLAGHNERRRKSS